MIGRLLFVLAALAWPGLAQAGAFGPGQLEHVRSFPSAHVDPRDVSVWLPADYDPKGPPYDVLYMHDGQNVFDPATSYTKIDWGVDEAATKLMDERAIRRTIVVGIWNTPKRLREYVPAKAFDRLPARYLDRVRGLYQGSPLSDGYLRFIVRELKPYVEARYNVARGPGHTAIMGSSMGGLISLYALAEYPHIFGAAGCVSTHWPLLLPPEGQELGDADVDAVATAFEGYLKSALPRPGSHRIYFDHGTETLDRHYGRYQARIDRLFASRGWQQGVNWVSRNFPGDGHNEQAWRGRVDVPLRFLLATQGKADAR